MVCVLFSYCFRIMLVWFWYGDGVVLVWFGSVSVWFGMVLSCVLVRFGTVLIWYCFNNVVVLVCCLSYV